MKGLTIFKATNLNSTKTAHKREQTVTVILPLPSYKNTVVGSDWRKIGLETRMSALPEPGYIRIVK
jgi:hypothetical protein